MKKRWLMWSGVMVENTVVLRKTEDRGTINARSPSAKVGPTSSSAREIANFSGSSAGRRSTTADKKTARAAVEK